MVNNIINNSFLFENIRKYRELFCAITVAHVNKIKEEIVLQLQ